MQMDHWQSWLLTLVALILSRTSWHTHTHTHSPLYWSQTSTGPFTVGNNCGLPCSMDTPTRDSKYIQPVCLKGLGMKIIYLHWKATPCSINFSALLCASVCKYMCIYLVLWHSLSCFFHFMQSFDIPINSNRKIRFFNPYIGLFLTLTNISLDVYLNKVRQTSSERPRKTSISKSNVM